MNKGFYQGVASMAGYGRRLESIANNLANVSTTGYKGSKSATRSFRVPGAHDGRQQLETTAIIDLSQGELRRTGNQLDLALHGPGFFAVESPRGEILTRGGSYQVDANGVLQTSEGYPLAWNGPAGTIDGTGEPVQIGADGSVRQGDRQVGVLRTVDYAASDRLRQLDGGYFRAPNYLQESTFTGAVHQGALEASNVTAFQELVEMIQLQRSFQSMSRMISNVKETYDRLARSRS